VSNQQGPVLQAPHKVFRQENPQPGPGPSAGGPVQVTPPRRVTSGRVVVLRRLVGLLLVAVPVLWAVQRAAPAGAALLNQGGLGPLKDLAATVIHPALSGDFLMVVLRATGITIAYAVLGAAGALVVGAVGGLVLSDAVWGPTPGMAVRAVRVLLRGLLVAVRSIHELIWALLLLSVLGLDPLVAVLAIALPFGAQTAQVFGETLDGVPPGPLRALRGAGARGLPAVVYGLIPGAGPLLISYSFYRLECSIRSTVLLGVVGVGGLGQELVVSLSSRTWGEVWTLVGAVVLLSAVVDLWSSRLRSDLALVSCSDWSGGNQATSGARVPGGSRWARWSARAVLPAVVLAWLASGVSVSGLFTPRTHQLTTRLLGDLWPPRLPRGGWPVLLGAVADTLAMAVLAMVVAVVITLLVGPWAVRSRAHGPRGVLQGGLWWVARAVLLVLRSIPPTIWAVVALLALFPGVLPGALALGLYTGGILGRLVAEAWESVDVRPRDALRRAGVNGGLSSLVATIPPSSHQLVTYTLYRFEICVRDTAVVGVVGAAGLGRLFQENLAAFRFPVITTLLAASLAVSIVVEVFGRRVRRALRA
jgi:phosphonate transport system permease protein